ncbi:hypothetical protein SAMN04487911_10239 [Arenibacter nanhaiticus]|uniref:Uncharacterized protein n=1 Tax=Arenibacter nanhaiticus TaxID=558155 RepID=A0A1M6B2V9_9FLAO|nr:hypothetical protein [Arenibacter nanhaiticus]SHI42793.1 hypothetical protein SAMN04487911_10239 [Arenibacter nanhaiticus]
MRNKITLLVFSFFIVSIVKAQEKITDDMREMYSKILYANKEPIFKDDIFQYKTVDYIASDHFFPAPPNQIVDQCIRTIKNSGQLITEAYSGSSDLYFKALLSEDVASYLSDEFTLTIKESGLQYENGNKIGLDVKSKTALNLGELKLKVRTEKEIDASQNILGSLKFDLEFLAKYEKVQLSRSDIGEIFKIGSCDFKLVDVFKNKIVLEKLCMDEEEELEIKVINFTGNGQVIQPYSYFELLELKEKNDNINVDGAYIRNEIDLYKIIYDIFLAKPEITFEEFDRLMTVDLLEGLNNATNYTILKSVGNFEGNFMLYSPKYSNKEFQISFD